jgi:hypothetical protein
VRCDGGSIVSKRDLLLKKAEASMGAVVSYELEVAQAQELQFEKRKDRPPMGKPKGLENTGVTFFVSSS